MFFEQDELPHICQKINNLLEKLFGDNFIQNAPYYPDIEYPNETIWAELKKKS